MQRSKVESFACLTFFVESFTCFCLHCVLCIDPPSSETRLYANTHTHTHIKQKITLEQATKAQKGIRGMALLLL